jgi:DNA polymerase V
MYDCDELFLDLAHIPAQTAAAYARIIKKTVTKWTGLPFSLGVGLSKTLAKCAIERTEKADGICVLATQSDIEALLDTLPIQDV